jgi:hypothetical protein
VGERLVVSPRLARRMLDIGTTRLYELIKAGEVESYLDGRSRKIIVDSIYQYIQRCLRTRSAKTEDPRPTRTAKRLDQSP